METLGDAPVVVQEWRDGESLRELLDTGARIPPEMAGRIVADAAEAVHHSHGRAIVEGRPFAHGALRAERVLVGIDGGVLVSGFGRAAEGDGPVPGPAEDVRALAALLLQCLAGESPSAAGLPGVPDRLAEVASRAAETGEAYEDAGRFREALEAAVPLAGPERVKAWADGVLPSDAGTRGRRRRSLESALSAAAEPEATPDPAPASRPVPSTEEVSEDSIVASLTPLPGTAVAVRRGEPGTQDADDLIVGEATGPMPVPGATSRRRSRTISSSARRRAHPSRAGRERDARDRLPSPCAPAIGRLGSGWCGGVRRAGDRLRGRPLPGALRPTRRARARQGRGRGRAPAPRPWRVADLADGHVEVERLPGQRVVQVDDDLVAAAPRGRRRGPISPLGPTAESSSPTFSSTSGGKAFRSTCWRPAGFRSP